MKRSAGILLYKKENDQYLDPYNIHPSKEGYKAIFDILLKEIDEKILK